jgi:glycerate 2-kinase
MTRSPEQLRADALAIWQAGVDAVRSDALVQDHIRIADGLLTIAGQTVPLDRTGRIAVVGCGKAGAGMAAGVEAALGDRVLDEKQVTGWVNVPDDCVRSLRRIHLHGARPPGVNEPTEAGVEGARRILELVRGLSADDLCICLISGGGSALLPAPVETIRLEDKLAVTRHLSGAGANIQQLNTVRKHLSRIKGGGLARECRAGQLIVLIISDVLGDPLDIIASGPTVPDRSTPADALAVLEEFDARRAGISDAVFRHLHDAALQPAAADSGPLAAQVTNCIIGNNATAVHAAAREAIRLGYETRSDAAEQLEGDAETLGRDLAERAVAMRNAGGAACLVSGGEPTVRLVPSDQRGLGGRNQQLVLAALERLGSVSTGWQSVLRGIVLLSGGTDGEDGPTDAAGAWLDQTLVPRMQAAGLEPGSFLRRNDAYHFFDALGALIRTGPTHTNVCDLRIVLTAP